MFWVLFCLGDEFVVVFWWVWDECWIVGECCLIVEYWYDIVVDIGVECYFGVFVCY